jgi:hypothetical protein
LDIVDGGAERFFRHEARRERPRQRGSFTNKTGTAGLQRGGTKRKTVRTGG